MGLGGIAKQEGFKKMDIESNNDSSSMIYVARFAAYGMDLTKSQANHICEYLFM